MVMKCVSSSSRWRIYAVVVDNTGNFQIRQTTLKHTCSVDATRNYHRLATTQVIGELMQSKFVGFKRGPTLAGIRKIMLDEFHVNVSYWKAWRAREIAMEKAHGSMARTKLRKFGRARRSSRRPKVTILIWKDRYLSHASRRSGMKPFGSTMRPELIFYRDMSGKRANEAHGGFGVSNGPSSSAKGLDRIEKRPG
ncbi:unnamed protein product [Microthlaspi erraticum]|uniref:Transposase MuDR plant domain-containing protein n=1 Tax=Microthlaspi erraticum TaxID=1685480 RepID=A0A6D2HRW5_9BRAS|nr:unnamed protein product [Microthlaspi erraticum]